MQTICPHCKTVFKVSAEHLKIADGFVRCGICKEVFNALEKPQPENKPSPIAAATNDAVAPAENIPASTSIPPRDSSAGKTTAELRTQQTAANKPAAEQVTATATASTADQIQTDLFAAPPAPAKPVTDAAATKTITTETITAETTAAEATTAATAKTEFTTAAKKAADLPPAQMKQAVPTQTAASATSGRTADKRPADKPAPAATSIQSAAEELKEVSNEDTSDTDLFDGVQSKLIPDEYRIPELHNTYSIWRDLAWSLAILALTASLFVEYTWFNRNELIGNPQLRPLVEKLCLVADCDTMELREPGEIEMTTRNIYTHPNVKNALMISGTLINHARFEQPYPNILIDFSDVRGEIIASRIFTPEDYLQLRTSSLKPMPSNTPVDFNMEIQDPGKNAMTYEFSFL